MTNTEAIIAFNKYKNENAWKRFDYDGAYWYQCVDLIRHYAKVNNYPPITSHGHAIDLWNQWLGDWYTRVVNSTFAYPPVGSIILFNTWKYGHIAIAGRGNMAWVEILEQNWGKGSATWLWTDAVRVSKNYYKNCVGWFIPKY